VTPAFGGKVAVTEGVLVGALLWLGTGVGAREAAIVGVRVGAVEGPVGAAVGLALGGCVAE
jgi:hypothetical protein